MQPRTFTKSKGLGKHNEAIYRKRVVHKVPRLSVALLINCSLANKSKGTDFHGILLKILGINTFSYKYGPFSNDVIQKSVIFTPNDSQLSE
jgi:hypothetical protein